MDMSASETKTTNTATPSLKKAQNNIAVNGKNWTGINHLVRFRQASLQQRLTPSFGNNKPFVFSGLILGTLLSLVFT